MFKHESQHQWDFTFSSVANFPPNMALFQEQIYFILFFTTQKQVVL